VKYSSKVAVTDDIDGEGASGWGVATGSAGDIDAVGVMSNVEIYSKRWYCDFHLLLYNDGAEQKGKPFMYVRPL
jgi:hypothetical protein